MAMYLRMQLCSNIASNADERLIARPQIHRICVLPGAEVVLGTVPKYENWSLVLLVKLA
jgi:hypothetical protein